MRKFSSLRGRRKDDINTKKDLELKNSAWTKSYKKDLYPGQTRTQYLSDFYKYALEILKPIISNMA